MALAIVCQERKKKKLDIENGEANDSHRVSYCVYETALIQYKRLTIKMIMRCVICRGFFHDPNQQRDLCICVCVHLCILAVVGCISFVLSMLGYW